ncbi:hypothetical protein LINPERPRIM_LOCUS515 [Linum perenne]
MKQIVVKIELARKWKGVYCPKILRKLAGRAEKSRFCHIIGNGKDGYEVRYKDGDRFSVQLDDAKCSCRSWELTGIPCPHAITCIISEGNDPARYISDWFTVDKYWKTYDNVMMPMDGHTTWVPSKYAIVLPPLSRKMPGRPKKKRVKSVEELMTRDKKDPTRISRVGRIMTCKTCKKEGHNSRTCSLKVCESLGLLSILLSYVIC